MHCVARIRQTAWVVLVLMLCISFLSLPFETATAQTGQNLVLNGSLESTDASGLPTGWKKGGYGGNTRVLAYPVPGVDGGKAVKTTITSYASGDAKWWFALVPVSAGTYVYSDDYMANVTSIITVQYQRADGTFFYKDIATLLASNTFKNVSVEFMVPADAAKITVFHLINKVGFVTIDNVALYEKDAPPPPPPPPPSGNIFETGAVSLRFDDAWFSQYEHAIPKLRNAGVKGTFYIATRQTAEQGFEGYMNKRQITEIFNDGHEIAAHSRTHRDLTVLSSTALQSEVEGSREDLLAWNVGPIHSFAVPFGAYNTTVINAIKSAGFLSDATADGHKLNDPGSDPYELTRYPGDTRVTLTLIKQKIDEAAANKTWLIIAFHHIDTSGQSYSITPSNFNQVVDYIAQKGIAVVTVSEGAEFLQ